jgi:hypothetical protein
MRNQENQQQFATNTALGSQEKHQQQQQQQQ